MPKPEEPTTAPVRPPTLPPDFPDIPQNPPSELQPPPPPSATPDQVAGATPAAEPEVEAKEELRSRNARLREKINAVLDQHPELRDATEELALDQGLHVEVGTPFLERINSKLQERARAIIERRPDLERLFDD